jgi:hypothetical protein
MRFISLCFIIVSFGAKHTTIDSHETWKCADPRAGEANPLFSVYITL